MDIRIKTVSEDKYDQIIEFLKPLGVEVVTGESNPLEAALFFFSRINTKLDNLGQLRHLDKVHKTLSSLSGAAADVGRYYYDLLEERRFRQQLAREFYNKLRLETSHQRVGTAERVPLFDGHQWMDHYEIIRAFKPYLSGERYNELLDEL